MGSRMPQHALSAASRNHTVALRVFILCSKARRSIPLGGVLKGGVNLFVTQKYFVTDGNFYFS